MNINTSLPILNPDVYLNYLQPSIASEYEITRNACLITIGALLWDILSSIRDDWKLVQTTKASFVLFAYFSSRTCALAVVLLSTLAKTGPIQNCGLVQLLVWIFWIFATGSSSYLFLKRVHAIFFQERLVRHAFTVFWLAAVGTSTVVLVGPLHDDYQIANTKHCMNTKIKSYVFAAFFVPVLFDAFVFFAVSFKILMTHRTTTKQMNWKTFCWGRALPRLSQAILQGGQQYYAITNGANVSRLIVATSPNVPPVLQLLPSIIAVALTSAMACRVFRNLKLEALQRTDVGIVTTIQFAGRELTNTHVSKNAGVTSAEVCLEQC